MVKPVKSKIHFFVHDMKGFKTCTHLTFDFVQELGTPNEKIWEGVSELPAMKKVTFTDYPYNQLRNKFGSLITEKGFDLMNRYVHVYNVAELLLVAPH